MQLTEHFALQEFTVSTVAGQCGIDNEPPPEVVAELQRLAETMEDVRLIFDSSPIIITSGYRCPELNRAVGGVADSAHIHGRACDFIVPGYSPLSICLKLELIVEHLEIDQLILEYGDWVHLGIAAEVDDARCHCLTIDRSGTRSGFA